MKTTLAFVRILESQDFVVHKERVSGLSAYTSIRPRLYEVRLLIRCKCVIRVSLPIFEGPCTYLRMLHRSPNPSLDREDETKETSFFQSTRSGCNDPPCCMWGYRPLPLYIRRCGCWKFLFEFRKERLHKKIFNIPNVIYKKCITPNEYQLYIDYYILHS